MKKLISLCLVCVMVMTLVFSASAVTLEDLKAGKTDYAGNKYDNSATGVYNSTSVVSQYATPILDGVKDACYSVTSAMEANYCSTGAFTNGTGGNSATLYSANDGTYLYLLLETEQNTALSGDDAITLGVDFINADNNEYVGITEDNYKAADYKAFAGFADTADDTFSKQGGIIWAQPFFDPYGNGSTNTLNYPAANGSAYVDESTSVDNSKKWQANKGAAQDDGVTFARIKNPNVTNGYVIEVRIELPQTIQEYIAAGNDVVIGLFFRYVVDAGKGTNDIGHFDVANDPNHFTETNTTNLVSGLVRVYTAYHDVVISGKTKTEETSTQVMGAQVTTPDDDGNYSIRFLSVLNTLDLANENIGFVVSCKVGDQSYDAEYVECNTVYNQITANNGAKKYNALQLEGDYIYALELTDLSVDTTYEFVVNTYHLDSEGNMVIVDTNARRVTVSCENDVITVTPTTPFAE